MVQVTSLRSISPASSASSAAAGVGVCLAAGDAQWLEELAAAASAEDLGHADIVGSVARLHAEGFLAASDISARALFLRLVMIGQCNLPLARLYEGHVNVLRLLTMLAGPPESADMSTLAADGVLFGVWGADGALPLSVTGQVLAGSKRFASGLGTVGWAIVTLGQGEAVRLAMLDVSDSSGHRPETWTKTGMRATASGDFVADGLTVLSLHWIGSAEQYLQEPGFIGVVWRICIEINTQLLQRQL